MTSILYHFLGDHISTERVDLLDQLVEFTINIISNQDEQVRILECLNSLNTLAKNDTARGKTARPRPKSTLSSDRELTRPRPSTSDQLVDNVGSLALVTDRVGVVGLVKDIAVDAKYQQTLEKIIARVCYPVFKYDLERNVKLTTSANAGLDVFHAACELCLTCLSLTNSSQIRNIIYDAALGSLQAYVEEQRFSENMKCLQVDSVIPIYTTLEILSQLFEKSNDDESQITFCILPDKDWLDACFLELLNVIEHAEDAVCGLVSTILIPKILKCCEATDNKVLILWERIKRMLSSSKQYIQDDINHSNNCFIILCAFINYFHPNTHLLDQQDIVATILSETLFWDVIQNGFSKGDSLTRKRALYLVKRAVELSEGIEMLGGDGPEGTRVPLFHWSLQNKAALIKLWSDIILILETLEEIQIHVVMPVMTRLSKVTEATYLPASGWPLLHTSWLVMIFERLFQHATKTISRWGVMQVMSLDLSTCPIFSQVGSKFVLGPVLQALSDYTLYIKTTEKSKSRFSDATEMMLGFFTSCVASLTVDQAKVFLQELLSAFVGLRTKPVPLAFLCQSLARVPSCKAWGNSSMKCLRELMSSGISTITPLHRGAIQCFLMDSAISLMDAADISLRQLWSTLAVLNRDECMQRGTILWQKIVNWLQLNASALKQDSKVQSLFEAIQLEVTEYLTISHTDGTPTTSSAKEATKVARMLLLIVDANHRAKEQLLGGQSLSDLIHPLTMVLQTIGSHVYLPVAKADKALQLLLAILDEADPLSLVDNDLMTELEKSVFSCTEEIFMYLTRRLNIMDESESIDENCLQIYISILDRLWNLLHQQPGSLVTTCLVKLINGCIPILTRSPNLASQKEVLRFIAVSKVLGWTLSSSASSSVAVNASVLNSIGPIDVFVKCTLRMASFGDTLGTAERGSLISTYLNSKWKILLHLLQRHSSEVYASWNPEDILTACLADLSIMQGLEVMPAMQCVKLLVAKVVCNPSSCLEALDVCWNVVQDSERGQRVYRACLEAFIQIAFQVDLMKSDSDILVDKLKEIANDFFVAGENKQGLVSLLAKQMSESLLALAEDDPHRCVSTALRYLDVLLNFYLFCPSLNKDLRLLQDVSASIVDMGDRCSVNQVYKSCNRDHRLVRVIAINLIVKLQADYPNILQELAPHMVDSLLQRKIDGHNLEWSESHKMSHRSMDTGCRSFSHCTSKKIF